MAPRSQEALLKQKDAKQKKILILLVPVLLVAGAFNVTRMMKNRSPVETAPTAAATTSATTTTAADASAAASGAAAPVGTAGAQAAASPVTPDGSAALVDSDPLADAEEGQLVSFGRFVSKDPFRQQLKTTTAPTPPSPPPAPARAEQAQTAQPAQPAEPAQPAQPAQPAAAPAASPPAETKPSTDTETSTPATPPAPVAPPAPPAATTPQTETGDTGAEEKTPPNTAGLTVNGVAESVLASSSFPASDPVFKLVAVKGKKIKIGLVTGSFSTGVPTIDLEVGESLTLVSQPDGIRYVIKLLGLSYDGSASG
jgi:hypothetical protein